METGGEGSEAGAGESVNESIELREQLREMRKVSGMTLKEVNELTGISLSFVSDIERGYASPSLHTLQKLATCYGKTITIKFVPNNWSDWEI